MGFGLFGNRHDKDFAELRRSVKRTSWKPLLIVLALILLAFFMSSRTISTEEFNNFQKLRFTTLQLPATWSGEIVHFHDIAKAWLVEHGVSSEVRLFDGISSYIFNLAIFFGDSAGGFGSTVSGIILNGFMKISFILIACWRIWLIIAIFGAVRSFNSVKPYVADDLLGQTGNGHVFYSGMRAALENLDETGAPDFLVPGLACLKRSSIQKLQQSKIYKILENHGVLNATNKALASIIVEYADYPAYVAKSGEEDKLDDIYEGAGLLDNAAEIIDKALTLFQECQTESALTVNRQRITSSNSEIEDRNFLPQKSAILPTSVASSSKRRMTAEEYQNAFKQALYRVLTLQQKSDLVTIRPEAVATALLAIEAGKPLGIERADSSWVRATNFQQLGARAVLHSIVEYPREYKSLERTMIRQALIYGLRKSVFGAVCFSTNISKQSLALRQWIEIALACPHELTRVTDEVQLFGISYELHDRWQAALFDAIARENQSVVEEGIATDGSMFFLPLTSILGLFDKVLDFEGKVLLKNLVRKVGEWQQEQLASIQDPEERVSIPDYERIPAELSQAEISDIVNTHNILAQRVAEWSYLRYILYHYSWLARRVGDSTVPESCVVFCAVHVDESVSGRNEAGFIGQAGMVPLRTTRLTENWGHRWKVKFREGHLPAIADTSEQFEKIMQGVSIYTDDLNETIGV